MNIKSYTNTKVGPFHDIKNMSHSELSIEYGIEIYENGNVWDPIEHKDFASLLEWADYMAEIEEHHSLPQYTKNNKTNTEDF